MKKSQNTARLLVALCARPGEGRRRVVHELSCCFKGRAKQALESTDEMDLWALMSWGELCLGLVSPRSGSGAGKEVEHSTNSLAYEVVRLMVDCGLVGCLMDALREVELNHPLAPAAAAALVRCLEIFSRNR